MPTTLQFVQDHYPWDALIRYMSHGWPTHVDVVWDDAHLLGARMRGGVKIRPASYLQSDAYKFRVTLPTTAAQDFRYREFLKAQIGKPYDFKALFGFAAGRDWRTDDRWYCSELVMAGLEPAHAGFFPYPLAASYERVTPWEALMVCSAFASVPQR